MAPFSGKKHLEEQTLEAQTTEQRVSKKSLAMALLLQDLQPRPMVM
jgi:hypothetical protein